MPPKPRFSPVLVLTFGVFAISFGSIFIRLAHNEDVPSLAIAAWRTGLASLFLLPLAFARRRMELTRLSRRDWGWALLSGGMLGLHFASWVSSLSYTTIASSTVLVTTSPLLVAVASPFFVHEPLSRPLKIGTAMALVGSIAVGLGDVLGVVNGRLSLTL
ncbi:MAG: DMT family transporter, partial [Anaerolineae bacterium]